MGDYMSDVDLKTNERVDERVYPGAPLKGTECDDGTRDSVPESPRVRLFARTVLAVSLLLVVGSGAYFAFNPDCAPVVRQVGTASVAAKADDAPMADEPGLPGADAAQDDSQRDSGASDGGAGRSDGSPGGSGEPSGMRGQSAANSNSPGASGPSGGQVSGTAGNPGGSNSAGSNQGASGQDSTSPQSPATISVSVTVDSSSVGSPVAASATVDLAPSSTVFDALRATGLSVDSRNSTFGAYVVGIGGLSEFDHGGGSGWKYKVNGAFPSHSASAHELHDGDNVVWVYVTG